MRKKVSIILVGMLIVSNCIFICLYAQAHKESKAAVDSCLEDWIGTYSYEEVTPESEAPFMFMDYNIRIYKEKDEIFAEINIDGQTTMAHAKAKVYGSASWISMVFEEYGSEHSIGGFENQGNSVLLSFRKEGTDLLTYWGAITPMLYEHEPSGERYFEKELGK